MTPFEKASSIEMLLWQLDTAIAKTLALRRFGAVTGYWESLTSEAREIRTAALSALESEGWVLVPVEPTKEMLLVGETAVEDSIDSGRDTDTTYIIEDPMKWASVAYRAMLASRPAAAAPASEG